MKNTTFIILFLSRLSFRCNNFNFIYQQPKNILDGLNTGTLESVNVDTAKFVSELLGRSSILTTTQSNRKLIRKKVSEEVFNLKTKL